MVEAHGEQNYLLHDQEMKKRGRVREGPGSPFPLQGYIPND